MPRGMLLRHSGGDVLAIVATTSSAPWSLTNAISSSMLAVAMTCAPRAFEELDGDDPDAATR
jgi:hypothetical protein